MRLSWSSAVTLRSTNSPYLASTSRRSLATSLDEILVDLDDLQLGFGHLALGLGDRGDELAALAFDAGGVALERGEAGDHRPGSSSTSRARRSSSLWIRSISLLLASCWAVSPLISSFSCPMRCCNCAFWPRRAERRSSNSRRSLVTALATVGSSMRAEQVGREGDGLGAVALGFQPRLARGQLVEALGDDGEIGARARCRRAAPAPRRL